MIQYYGKSISKEMKRLVRDTKFLSNEITMRFKKDAFLAWGADNNIDLYFTRDLPGTQTECVVMEGVSVYFDCVEDAVAFKLWWI